MNNCGMMTIKIELNVINVSTNNDNIVNWSSFQYIISLIKSNNLNIGPDFCTKFRKLMDYSLPDISYSQ